MSTESQTKSYEGKAIMEGGFLYEPTSETEPAEILESAKNAAREHGVHFPKSECSVLIPGRGEYHFDENTTIEDFNIEDKRLEVLPDAQAAVEELQLNLRDLSLSQLEEIIAFAKNINA